MELQLKELQESSFKHSENILLEKKWGVAPGQGHTSGNVEGHEDPVTGYSTKKRIESLSTRSPYSTPYNSSASIGITSQNSKHKVPPLNLGNRRPSSCSRTSLGMDSNSARWQDVNLEDFPMPSSHRLRSMRRNESVSSAVSTARLHSSDSIASFLSACDSDRQSRTLRSHWAPSKRSFVDLPIAEDRGFSLHLECEDQGILPSGQPTKQVPLVSGAGPSAGPTPKSDDSYVEMAELAADSSVDLLQLLYQTQAQRRFRCEHNVLPQGLPP